MGVLYLLTILMGIFAQGFVSERLVNFGDAAATATKILAHRSLFEWSFTVYMIEMACQIMTTALFYFLLKPVSRSIALVAAFLSLSGCIIKAFSRVFYIAPLFVLGGAQYLSVFSPQQLQAPALLFLKVNDRGAAMAAVDTLSGLVEPAPLRVNPHDLDDLGVPDGGSVRLRSATTSVVVPVHPDESLPRRVVATEFNVPLGDGTVADLIDRAFPVVDLRMETP